MKNKKNIKNKVNRTVILKCPMCGIEMEITDIYGVEIDYCKEHGVWLDRGELEEVCDGIRTNLKIKQEYRDATMRDKGRFQGVMFGMWSFLFK